MNKGATHYITMYISVHLGCNPPRRGSDCLAQTLGQATQRALVPARPCPIWPLEISSLSLEVARPTLRHRTTTTSSNAFSNRVCIAAIDATIEYCYGSRHCYCFTSSALMELLVR